MMSAPGLPPDALSPEGQFPMRTKSTPRPRSIAWGPELFAWIHDQCEIQPSPDPELSQPCLIWQRSLRRGYGVAWIQDRLRYVHRVVYALHEGLPTTDALDGLILHHCDVPACCEPSHLYQGSQRDNRRDAMRRDRWLPQVLGARNGAAKLTAQDVRSIRARYALGGIGQRALARAYGVGQSQINRVLRSENWSHVTEDV